MKPDLALLNAGELLTLASETPPLGLVEDGALVVKDGRVVWVGTTREFKRKSFLKARRTIDAAGRLVAPGFIDPHNHMVFAGNREDEMERKIQGESYMSILGSGGGISRTIRETRESSALRLASEASGRMRQLVSNGVTTIEVKTGYGQDVAGEAKMLRVVKMLSKRGGPELVPTFLGLHARPSGPLGSEYVDYVIRKLLPAIAPMKPVFSDCFLEEGAFSREECSRYLLASRELGLKLKIHADEFGNSGGAALAAELGCVSADHLAHSEASGLEMMARKGVIAVLLPGTCLCSGIPYADSKMIAAAGCRVALGTDLSPNSWIESPQLVMALACNAMRMTPADAVSGFTVNAAAALDRGDIGRLVPGAKADFVIHDVPSYRFLPYRVGGRYVSSVFKEGSEIYSQARN